MKFPIVNIAGFLILLLFLDSCSNQDSISEYVIALSQPTLDDAWRESMIQEINKELLFYPEIELIITDADNDNNKQIAQIESLLEQNIDLLIVSPNESKP